MTLPEAGTASFRVKVAAVPLTVAEPSGFPLRVRDKLVIPELGLPVPETETVRFVKVTGEELGFVTTTWSTGTLAEPGSWVESPGAPEPAAAWRVTGVGVGWPVKVAVAVNVAVEVRVFVAVGCPVEV